MGQFRKMFRKMGVDGHFDPIPIKITEDKIITNTSDEGNTCRCTVEFTEFDIELEEDEEEMVFEVITDNLLDMLSPCPSDAHTIMTAIGQSKLQFDTPNERIQYTVQSTSEGEFIDGQHFEKDGDELYMFPSEEDEKVKLPSAIKIGSKEWSALNTRRKKSDELDAIRINIDGSDVFGHIGELGQESVNPRRYEIDVEEILESEENDIKFSMIIDEVGKTIGGTVKLYWAGYSPLFIVDEEEDYSAVYVVAPRKEQ